MDDGPGGRREKRDGARQEREAAFALRRKGTLCFEPALELFQLGPQLADVVELDLVDDESQRSVLCPVVDPTAKDEDLAVFGQGREALGVVRVDERADEALAVADGKAVVALRALLHAADFAFDEQGGQGPQLATDLVRKLSDRVGPLSFFGFQHRD